MRSTLIFHISIVVLLSITVKSQSDSSNDYFLKQKQIYALRNSWKDQLNDQQKSIPLLSGALLNLAKRGYKTGMDLRESTEILTLSKHEIAISLLIETLDLQLSTVRSTETISTFMDMRYPSLKALNSFGKNAIPALMDRITSDKEDSRRWINAIYSVGDIEGFNNEDVRDAFYFQQSNRYEEQERFLRYLSNDISELVLQDNLLPKATQTEKPVFSDEQLRSCFEKSLLIWKAGPQPPANLPIDAPQPPEPVEVPVAGAPTPEQIEKTILELGDMRCEYAIPALYRRLDFKVTRADESFYYPAVTALSKFGESAIEPLIGQLAQPYQKQISYQNGVSVLVNITGSEVKANEALLKGAEEAKRRSTYIRDMVKKWESPE